MGSLEISAVQEGSAEKTMSSTDVLLSLRGKVLEKPQRKPSHLLHGDSEKACPVQLENEEWTPYNGDLHMQGIKVIVNNPTPKKTKVDTFADTMLLIDIYRHKMELETFEKKEKKIREMALQQKKKVEESRGPVVTYKL